MKYIKTFEQFVNENNVDEIASRFKPKKPTWPFFFQIFAREVEKDGEREKHKVTVGKDEDLNDVKRQVLKDYPHNKYYYTLWKNVRGGFKNIATNESEELTEDFLYEASAKYNKGDTVQYRMDIPASGMVATSKAEKSKNVKSERIVKVTKKHGQIVYVLKNGIEISDSEIIGLDESVVLEKKVQIEPGNEYLVKADNTIEGWSGGKDYELFVNDILSIEDYKKGSAYATVVIWRRLGGATKPFKVAIEDIEDLIQFKELVAESVIEKDIDSINEGTIKDIAKHYKVGYGFTFATLDNKKFTIPRKAEIEITDTDSKAKTITFKITKGKLDGYGPMPKKEFEITLADFLHFFNASELQLNESLNENNPEYIKTFEDFVNESYQINEQEIRYNRLTAILEKRGLLDIIAPDLGGKVAGGRADKAYSKAVKKLTDAGFAEVDSDSIMSQSSSNVNNSTTFQHPTSPTQVKLHLYYGYTIKDNYFDYTFGNKPMSISIKNDSDYNERLANYNDLAELKDIIFGIKVNRHGWDETVSVDQNIKDYVMAELRAIADYTSKKTNIKKFVNLGLDLANDKDFEEFVRARGCIINKNYLGKASDIRVQNNSKLKLNPDTLSTAMGKGLFRDNRIGFAYVKLNDKGDVEYLIGDLLKLPPIF